MHLFNEQIILSKGTYKRGCKQSKPIKSIPTLHWQVSKNNEWEWNITTHNLYRTGMTHVQERVLPADWDADWMQGSWLCAVPQWPRQRRGPEHSSTAASPLSTTLMAPLAANDPRTPACLQAWNYGFRRHHGTDTNPMPCSSLGVLRHTHTHTHTHTLTHTHTHLTSHPHLTPRDRADLLTRPVESLSKCESV